MAKQVIGIGSVANDGTGDTLRAAGQKINDNFTELYASGGGAPAYIHGTIDLSTYPGVVLGPVDATQRLANGVAMQAAFDEAETNRKYVEAPDGRYEYNASRVETNVPLLGGGTTSVNVGLQVPAYAPGLHGNFNLVSTLFIQFNPDHPALTLGSGHGEVRATGAEYRGITTAYGQGLTPGPNSRGFLIGSQMQSKFDQLRFDKFESGGMTLPYIGWDHLFNLGSWFFSNQIGTLIIDGGQEHVMRVKTNGTGNTFDNVYLGRSEVIDGNLTMPTVNGAMLVYEDGHQGTFRQLNLEWNSSNNLMRFVNTRGVLVDSLHIEGCRLIGADPSIIYNEIGMVNMRSVQFFDVSIDSADGITGTPSLFKSWGDSVTRIESLDARWHVNPITTFGYANIPFRLYTPSPTADQKPIFQIDQMHAQGHEATFDLDTTLPAATYGGVNDFGSYRWNRNRSRTEDGSIGAPDGNGAFTVYGAHRHSRIVFWDVMTANRQVVLSDKIAATGFGSTIPVEVGDTREITRSEWATGAFNVLVRNPANNATLATLTTTSTSVLLIWSGTAWVLA